MSFFKIKLRPTDIKFSLYIRRRDKWTCQRCGKRYQEGQRGLDNSHYWERGHESTRFELDNCDALCHLPCHDIWGHGEERDKYKEFKIKQLGEDRFKSLDIQAHTTKKRDDVMDLLIINKLLKELS